MFISTQCNSNNIYAFCHRISTRNPFFGQNCLNLLKKDPKRKKLYKITNISLFFLQQPKVLLNDDRYTLKKNWPVTSFSTHSMRIAFDRQCWQWYSYSRYRNTSRADTQPLLSSCWIPIAELMPNKLHLCQEYHHTSLVPKFRRV